MYLRLSLSAAALLTAVGYAAAQQPSADTQQQQRHDQMLQTVPGKNGKEEPSAHLDTSSDTAAFVNGKLNVPGAPQDGQTTPAKFSKHNAEIDVVPMMALSLNLTGAEKHRIAESVAKTNAPVEAIDGKPADMLAVTTPANDLPNEITEEIPAMKGLKVVRTKDKILLVRATNMVIRDVIAN